MLFRAIFWIGVVAVLMPREPDLGLGRPGASHALVPDLERDADGRAHFSIESGGKKVEVLFGPRYPAAEFFVPRLRNQSNAVSDSGAQTVCFEPMTGITNAVNLYHEGKYSGLQILAPGANWTESFWIRASGI